MKNRNNELVMPSNKMDDIDEEVDLAAKIRARNDSLYEKDIEHHLLGRGDGSMTLEGLRDYYRSMASAEKR